MLITVNYTPADTFLIGTTGPLTYTLNLHQQVMGEFPTALDIVKSLTVNGAPWSEGVIAGTYSYIQTGATSSSTDTSQTYQITPNSLTPWVNGDLVEYSLELTTHNISLGTTGHYGPIVTSHVVFDGQLIYLSSFGPYEVFGSSAVAEFVQVDATPLTDTFRGGAGIVLYSFGGSIAPIVSSFLTQQLPPGWSSSSFPTIGGLRVTSPVTGPTDPTCDVSFNGISLTARYYIDSSNYVSISSTVASVVVAGVTIASAAVPASQVSNSIRIIRCGTTVYVYLGSILLLSSFYFNSVGSGQLQVTAGLLHSVIRNTSALLDSTPLQNLISIGSNRIAGTISASNIFRVGSRNLTVFGPSTPAVTYPFTYTYPIGKTLGPQIIDFGDVSLRD